MTWYDITPSGPPVRGWLHVFESTARNWTDAARDAESVRDEFRRIVNGEGMGTFQGRAAEAFESIVEEAQVVLDDVPVVFRSIGSILAGHAAQLRPLTDAAEAALARAKIAKAEREVAAGHAAASEARVVTLKRQVAELRSQAPEQSAGALATAEQALTRETSFRNGKRSEAAASAAQLSDELTLWEELRCREDELNKSTADLLDSVNLRTLANPSNFERFFGALGGFVSDQIFGFVADLAEHLGGLVSSLWDGEFGHAIWHLRGILDAFLEILDLVALVVIAAVVVVGTVATGGAALALLVPLAHIAAYVAGAKLLTTAAIVYGGIESESGERLGFLDLAFDVTDFLTRVAAVGAVGAMQAQGTKSNAVFRHIARDRGFVFKHNFGVKAEVQKSFVGVAKKEVGSRVVDAVPDLMREATYSPTADGFAAVNESMYGRPAPSDPRHKLLDRETQQIRASFRGLSAPVQPVLVGTY